MKNKEKDVLFQFLSNSKVSDREISKRFNTSQSTITRVRHKLEKDVIKSYTIIPNLSKLGINLIAFTFANMPTPTPELMKKMRDLIEEEPNVVFSAHGEGMRKTGIFISFHKEFSDYSEFMRKTRLACKGFSETVESFIVSTNRLEKTLNMSKAVEYLVKDNNDKIE